MRLPDLSERQRRVLSLLVTQHVSSARPVASSSLTVGGGFAWAPATVRLVLLELDRMGLLEQPHSASGRVPSDRGYRLFVDGLMDPEPVSEAEREEIERALAAAAPYVEQLLRQASRLLADRTAQMGFAVGPTVDGPRPKPAPDVYFGGASHVARQPEFREAERLRPVLELMDRTEPWRDLLGTHGEPGLHVTIGREHSRPELAHLSLVSFHLGGPGNVSIGLLGPRRMDYARAMGLVGYVGQRLTSLL